MSRRKKRGPSPAGKESGEQKSEAQRAVQLPAARPPKKNLPLLLVCVALLGVWLVLLVLLAWTS